MNKKVSIIIASALAVVLVVVLALSFSKKKPVEQPPVGQPAITNIDTEQPNNLDALNKAKDEDVFVPEEKIVPAEDPDPELVAKEIMDQFGIEEPDVQVFYNAEGDTDGDGMISKQEWQAWVDTHPEDLDQNMRIDEPEQHAYCSLIDDVTTLKVNTDNGRAL